MIAHQQVYDAFARLLTYPRGDYKQEIIRCHDCLVAQAHISSGILIDKRDNSPSEMERYAIAAAHLQKFRDDTSGLTLEELEELYTRTFDINPISSLEIGWHLYGESYERGAFLVRMRDILRTCGVEESSELPDHLTHVLNALGRMESAEAKEFIRMFLLKSISKILDGFKEKDNPYQNVLLAIETLIKEESTVLIEE